MRRGECDLRHELIPLAKLLAVKRQMFADEDSIQIGRMAVQNKIFPLMEVEDGARWRFTVDHRGDPVEPYLKKQGRFRHLKDWQIAKIQTDVNERWRVLENRVRYGT
jgi:pyruvate/2-oxoacid:ferredoxin oxidoreductase beta subunit